MIIKIKPLKNIQDVKEAHRSILEEFKITLRDGCDYKFENVETFNKMLQLLNENKKFQLKAECRGVFLGCAVALDPDFEEKSIFLRVLIVKKGVQKMGIARRLLKEIEKVLKKKGFNTLKVMEKEGSNGFFIRAGFIPFLYVSSTEKQDIEKIKEANTQNFKILKEYEEDGRHVLKFDVEEEAVYQDKKKFKKISDRIKADFIYEKILR